MYIKFLIPVFALLFSFSSLAKDSTPAPVFLLQTNAPLPTTESDSVLIHYNSKHFDPSLLDNYTKAELIQIIRTNSYPSFEKNKKRTHFVVPFGPTIDWNQQESNTKKYVNSSDIKQKKTLVDEFNNYRNEFSREAIQSINENLENLSESDLRTFLSKKHGFLLAFGDRFEKTFKFLRIPPPYKFIQNLLNSLNTIFFQKSDQFVKSNTYGVPIFVTVGFGAATGRLIYDFLIVKTPLKKFISPNFGFYLSSSFGIGISRVQSQNQAAWVLDLFFDFESLKRAFLPIIEGGVSAGLGLYMETRSLPEEGQRFFLSKNAYNAAMYAPLIGSIRSGKSGLSNQHSLGIAFPFPSTFYETTVSRHYLHIVLKKPLPMEKRSRSVTSEFISGLDQFLRSSKKQKLACLKFY